MTRVPRFDVLFEPLKIKKIVLIALIWSPVLYADNTVTMTLASDYLLSGVSQTQGSPAMQVAIDWLGEGGSYAEVFISSVDYFDEDDTYAEADFITGYVSSINETISIDAGLAYYTFHGHDDNSYKSSDFNFFELSLYTEFYQSTQLGVAYAENFLGVGVKSYAIELSHRFSMGAYDVMLIADRNLSSDKEKWDWFGENSYNHGAIHVTRNIDGFDCLLGVETTDVDSRSDPAGDAESVLFISVSKTVSF